MAGKNIKEKIDSILKKSKKLFQRIKIILPIIKEAP